MIRALSTLAAISALAVSAAPVASAGPVKAPPKPPQMSYSLKNSMVSGFGVKTAPPKPLGNGIVGSDHAWGNYHFKAVAAAPLASSGTSKVKDGLSNTVMVAD